MFLCLTFFSFPPEERNAYKKVWRFDTRRKRKVGDPRVSGSEEETHPKELNFSCRLISEAPILQLKKQKKSWKWKEGGGGKAEQCRGQEKSLCLE